MSARRDAFVREYPKDFNATQAAIRAGYSPKTANQQGSRLLANAKVQELLAERVKEALKDSDVTIQMVVEGLLLEARGLREDEHGNTSPSLDTTSPARVSAWEKLGKYLNMFTDRVEVSGGITTTALPWDRMYDGGGDADA